MDSGSQLWHRVADGRTAAVIGELPLPSDPTRAPDLVLVSCDSVEPLGSIREAAHRLERLLSSAHANGWVLHKTKTPREAFALSRDTAADVNGFIDLLQESEIAARRATALVFCHVERADKATLDFLRRLVLRSPLPLSMIFVYSRPMRSGNAHDLLNAVELMEGKAGIFLGECSELRQA